MNDSTLITQDTTVTAQYEANTYTVKINPNGASGSTKTYTVFYGQKWSVPSCPFSRTGYTFSGYSGGYSAGQSITITGDISINCNWSIKTYQVSINPNGASGSTKYYSVTHGSTWTVPSCPFSRSGYNFSGYSGGYSVGQRVTVTSNININCNWSKIPTVNDLSNPTVSSKGTNKYWVEGYEGSGSSGYFNLTISATISFGMALPSGSSVIVTVDCSSCSKGSYSYTLSSVSGTKIVLNKTVEETNRVVTDLYGWDSYPINKITVRVAFGGSSRSFQVSL